MVEKSLYIMSAAAMDHLEYKQKLLDKKTLCVTEKFRSLFEKVAQI